MVNGDSAKPITVSCPVCASWPTEPCSVPTGSGQRYVRWFHLKREDAVKTTTKGDAMRIDNVLVQLINTDPFTVVFADESSGEEVVVTGRAKVQAVVSTLDYFLKTVGIHEH